MSTIAAGTARTAAGGCGNDGDPVAFAETFGYGPICVGTSAFFTIDRVICLAEAAHDLKFMIAFFTDIFVNRHRLLLDLQ